MAVISYAYISNLIVTMLVGIFYASIGSANIGMFQLCLFVPIMLFGMIINSKHLCIRYPLCDSLHLLSCPRAACARNVAFLPV